MNENSGEQSICGICGARLSPECSFCGECGSAVMDGPKPGEVVVPAAVSAAAGSPYSQPVEREVRSGLPAANPALRTSGDGARHALPMPGSAYFAAVGSGLQAAGGFLVLGVWLVFRGSQWGNSSDELLPLLVGLNLVILGLMSCIGLVIRKSWSRGMGMALQILFFLLGTILMGGSGNEQLFCLGFFWLWALFQWIALNRPSLVEYLKD